MSKDASIPSLISTIEGIVNIGKKESPPLEEELSDLLKIIAQYKLNPNQEAVVSILCGCSRIHSEVQREGASDEWVDNMWDVAIALQDNLLPAP